MALPSYPEVKDLDDLFGFTAARKKAEEAVGNDAAVYEEPNFIQHRIFLNQVDTFNAKYISSYLTDQIFGASKKGDDDEEGEGEEEMGEEPEAAPKTTKAVPEYKYEIIGTLQKNFHKKTEDILFTINEDAPDFTANIMKCGYVVYDITKDPEEIPKALTTLAAIENEIESLKELGPKTFKSIEEVRVFILISTVMTWALTKPIDPEEPELPFTEADYKKRKPHPNYTEHINCEREVVLKGRKASGWGVNIEKLTVTRLRHLIGVIMYFKHSLKFSKEPVDVAVHFTFIWKKNKDKLKTYVIASGIIYGAEEDDLTFLFKLAWNNEKELPVFRPGKNFVPLIYVKDLAKVLHALMENLPKKQYILAVEQTPATFKQIAKALTKTMGSGKIKEVTAEEAFLYKEITQSLYERYTVNLIMEPGIIAEDFEIEWQNELNLAENMGNIVNEFKKTRELKPIRIILHGPPAAGKTRIAKQLSECYGAHYVNVKTVIDNTLKDMRETIEKQKAKIQAEEKAKAAEEGGGATDEEAEGEEEEEEEEEVDLEELEEQLKEIENTMAESENGKLPDDQVTSLIKTFITSNRCQNQGYIIDGYPKTLEQTKALFGGGGEGGEEDEELGEEEGGGGGGEGGGSKILPEYVISLQATDEFLCERIMSQPEREIQGTHYMEESMLRRLAEFRSNNTEDNTLLNFFDEIEIHPIVINVMEDQTPSMLNIIKMLKDRLGKPVSFGITPEEEEEFIRLENERQKLLAREAQMMKELLEQQAVEHHQSKMEQWTELLEQLQIEEEKLLVAQGEPLRHYLIKFVFPTLSQGLLEVARIKPDDPVDFLAEYLFKKNPEGHMFDPSYTRDGKLISDSFKENAEEDLMCLCGKDNTPRCT